MVNSKLKVIFNIKGPMIDGKEKECHRGTSFSRGAVLFEEPI